MTNLWPQIKRCFDPYIVELLQKTGTIADKNKCTIYLVGGAVRDLLLERPCTDFDLVVEGNGSNLLAQLFEGLTGKLNVYPRFSTAKLIHDKWVFDVVTARYEVYPQPGSLPVVFPGNIKQDLFRRDFTVNAMAVSLSPLNLGELIDPYGGKLDLKNRMLRILHNNSFVDDPTRMFRAVRYEARLGFALEPETERLFRDYSRMVLEVGGDRIRREIELILQEELPERILKRADILGLFYPISVQLKADEWIEEKFEIARQQTKPTAVHYFCLMLYRMEDEETERIVAYLKLPRWFSKPVRDIIRLKPVLPSLTEPGVSNIDLYRLLKQFSTQSLFIAHIAEGDLRVRERLELYLKKLRFVRPGLNGGDLISLGIPTGPVIGKIMEALIEARLIGRIRNRNEEKEFACLFYQDIKEK